MNMFRATSGERKDCVRYDQNHDTEMRPKEVSSHLLILSLYICRLADMWTRDMWPGVRIPGVGDL